MFTGTINDRVLTNQSARSMSVIYVDYVGDSNPSSRDLPYMHYF